MTLPNYQASGNAAQGAASVSPPWPAVHAVNDVALLFVATANEAAVLSDPQGFVEITGSPVGTGLAGVIGSTRLTVFWNRATSTSMPTPTLADAGDHISSRMATFRGVTAVQYPIHLVASDTLGVPDTAIAIPGATTTVNDCLIVLLVSQAIDGSAMVVSGQANADLTNVTEQFEVNTSTGVGGGFCLMYGGKATAGAFGVTTATLSSPSAQARMAVALLPVGPNEGALGYVHPFQVDPLSVHPLDIHPVTWTGP